MVKMWNGEPKPRVCRRDNEYMSHAGVTWYDFRVGDVLLRELTRFGLAFCDKSPVVEINARESHPAKDP
jgi:hypothetical protein